MFIFVIFIVFIGGGWLLGKGAGTFVFRDSTDFYDEKEPNITINNYTTEQHLHVTETQLKELANKK